MLDSSNHTTTCTPQIQNLILATQPTGLQATPKDLLRASVSVLLHTSRVNMSHIRAEHGLNQVKQKPARLSHSRTNIVPQCQRKLKTHTHTHHHGAIHTKHVD